MRRGSTFTSGGDLSSEEKKNVDALIDNFIDIVNKISVEKRLRRAVVRSQLTCNVWIIIDANKIIVIGSPTHNVPTRIYLSRNDLDVSIDEVGGIALYDFGINDFFYVIFPKSLLELPLNEEQSKTLEAIAIEHVNNEHNRVIEMNNLIQINPIFGPASFKLNHSMVFVLMPFKQDLTLVYNSIIKKTIEERLNLICKRGDEIISTSAIMQDIWKNICEARLIIADLTEFNPNVMYELGIAHTLGKETILIYQKNNEEKKFPFDVSHIRRIEYENTATGGANLAESLENTILSLKNVG